MFSNHQELKPDRKCVSTNPRTGSQAKKLPAPDDSHRQSKLQQQDKNAISGASPREDDSFVHSQLGGSGVSIHSLSYLN